MTQLKRTTKKVNLTTVSDEQSKADTGVTSSLAPGASRSGGTRQGQLCLVVHHQWVRRRTGPRGCCGAMVLGVLQSKV
jgi:hypothetical protein